MRLQTGEPAGPGIQEQHERRSLFVALLAASALILLRSAVYVWYEHAAIDSDQAIYGLMAKHLIEGRAFPLFMYGQDYMLGVDALIAAPFIALFGLTVFALHLSIVFTNLVVAAVLVITLCRDAALRPWQAVVATLPFTFAPPVTSGYLTEVGGNIGPLLYVPALWLLRNRPIPFGCLLAIGVMHREFTIYAVPVLLLQQAWNGELWTARSLRNWVVAMVVAAATWQSVQALRPYSDVRGPGTSGTQAPEDSGLSATTGRMSFVWAELPERARRMVGGHFQGMFGAAKADTPTAAQGHDRLFWPFTLGLLATMGAVLAVAVSLGHGPTSDWVARASHTEFPIFLTGVGVTAVIVYVLVRPAGIFVDRYALLALYVPVGVVSWCFSIAPPRWVTIVPVATVLLMAASAAVDHRTLAQRYWNDREPNDLRVLADELERRHISVAMANYWRAYKLTFYTRERVKIASSDVVRIDEYQHLAAAEGDDLIVIQERPCAGGDRVSSWFLCRLGSTRLP